VTDSGGDEGPEGEIGSAANSRCAEPGRPSPSGPWQADGYGRNVRRARHTTMSRCVSLRGRTPEGRNPMSAIGVKQTRGLREEEAVRRVENPGDGTNRVRQTRVRWTPEVASAEGARTPGEGPEPRGDPAGAVGIETSKEGGTSGEDRRAVASRAAGEAKGRPHSRAAWANTPRDANGKGGAHNQ
jgi:hypothetical protein